MWRVTICLTVSLLEVSAQDSTPSEAVRSGTSVKDGGEAEAIRRQLMANNYDYMSRSNEYRDPTPSGGPSLGIHVNDIFIPRARDFKDPSQDIDDGAKDSKSVRESDLLYYVQDERLRSLPHRYHQVDTVSETTPEGTDTTPTVPTPAPTYKLIKVGAGGGRRSGGLARFLREESSLGVALVSLDRRPFPDFRLPPARKQPLPPTPLHLDAGARVQDE